MSEFRHAEYINVMLWGKRVGVVAPVPNRKAYAFSYDPKWIDGGIEVAPMLMPLSPRTYTFHTDESTWHGLPPFVADALPDEFGNRLIDAWMAQRGVRKEQITPLDRLAYLANRGMGALEFTPSANAPRPRNPSIIEVSKIVETARANIAGNLLDTESEAAIRQLVQVGTSAGGQRAKAVIAFNEKTGKIQSGQIPAHDGFEQWLLKLDGVTPDPKGGEAVAGQSSGYGRVEYAYHLMAKACGLDMMPCRLIEENGRAHFMTRRFDREDGGHIKHHVSTLCAMERLDYRQISTHDYSQLFLAGEALTLPGAQMDEMFRRMVFNVLSMNNDDHTKNFAFLLRDGMEAWELAPAYDLTFSYREDSQWVSQHLMSVNGKFKDIAESDMLSVAERHHIPDPEKIIAQVRDGVARWSEFSEKAGVPKDLDSTIIDGLGIATRAMDAKADVRKGRNYGG